MSASAAEVVASVDADAAGLAKVLSFIEAHETRRQTSGEPALFLAGAEEGDRVELTSELHQLLRQLAEALRSGRSVSVMALDQEIGTQQAADLLGLSRPTVVKLIEDGELPAHVPGSVRRRLRLADVLSYREKLRTRRESLIDDFSEQYGEDDPDELAALVAEARRAR